MVSFGGRKVVLDQLEHVGERRQREHQHHQPLDAGRDDEAVARMLEVMQQIAIKEILALFLQTHRRINFRLRLGRHHRAQKLDIRGRHFHVDQKIRVREAENDQQLLAL
ncbi:hypothetical protein QF000_005807 [Paraburkholderia atlantica]